jgi:AcrR family transcriptional regulator
MVNPSITRDLDTERAIFEAARDIFHERGYDGARMQEIADRAGINKSLLHYYYRSKDRLFEAVFRETAGQVLPRIFQTLASDYPLGLKIRRLVEVYISQLQRYPHLPRFIINELNRNPQRLREMIGESARPLIPVLKRQIQEAAAAGRIRHIAPEDLIINLIGLCVFPFIGRPILQTALEKSDEEYESLVESRKRTVTEFVFNALRP